MMHLAHDTLTEARHPHGLGGSWFGVYPALVSDIKDPDGQGRVQIHLPWSPDTGGAVYEAWARLGTLTGGKNRGSWFIPDVNDEVLVLFEAGDPRRPYVIGGLWNGSDAPPQSMDGSGQNNKKVLRSRNGVKITMDDTNGKETFLVETPGGQKITLADGPGRIVIEDSNGNSVKLESAGITVTASAKVTINASTAEVNVSGLTVTSPTSRFNGVVHADTVICDSIIRASYTPGAGNIW